MNAPTAFGHLLPADVREKVARTRTFAQIIAELGEQHDRHVAAIEATERRLAEEDARMANPEQAR